LRDLRDDFAEAEDEESFLERYQSVSSYSDEYVNKDDLREEFRPVLDIEVGEVTDVIDRGSQVSILKKLDENEEEVQFVNLTLNIEADPVSTIDARAEEADDFSFYAEEEGFQTEAERQGLEIQTAFATEDNNFIAGLGQSQQIMNFLETASTGDLSEPLELNDQFVVLRVTNIIPEGVRPFSEVESQIRNIVVTEKRKELMEQRVRELLESADSLEELAEAADKEFTQADNLRMGSAIIQGGGREPQVIGAIFGYDEDELSDPLRGNNAVFVTRIDSRTEADLSDLDASDRRELRRELEEDKSSSFTAVWLDRLKEQADITDNRSRMLQ
jgi:peptidyl-prolyl cis-trans isomerase D